MITLHDVLTFRRRSLRDQPKDVYVIPVHGSKPMLSTFRAPGCRFLGSYTETIGASELLDDVQHALREMAA